MGAIKGVPKKATISEEDRKVLLAEGFADPVFFLTTYLPHLFPTTPPWVHRGILAIATRKTDFLLKYGDLEKILKHFVWREDPNPNVICKEVPLFIAHRDDAGNIISLDLNVEANSVVMMPRGFSKTTLLGIGVALYEILFKVHDFLVFLSETGTHAEIQLTNVRRELEANTLIHAVFGKLQPEDKSGLKWTSTHIETTTGVIAISRGRGGQVRGLNIRGKRPNRIYIDDVEDSESVKTEEQRTKTRDWLYKDVIPALPLLDKSAGIVMLGTLLHSESLLMTVMKDPLWTAVRFAAIDKDGEALWEMMMSLEKLAGLRKSFRLAGQANAFNMEYMSLISDEADAKFKRSQFIYLPCSKLECVQIGLALDPAISTDPNACYASIAVVGMRTTGRLSLLEYWNKVGASPREQINKFFELYRKWTPQKAGVESNAFQAALVHIMQEEMFRQKTYFEIIKIMHSKKKEERIEGILQPRYAAGYFEHTQVFSEYESQLLDYPNGKVDGPDVVAMAVALLDSAAPAAIGEGTDLGDDEYEPLDEVFEGDWRQH